MIADGDKYAAIVYEAMCLSVAKDIAKLAATVCGKVDRIILTGGISYSKYVSEYITDHVSFICPVEVMAGEYEMEALAAGSSESSEAKKSFRTSARSQQQLKTGSVSYRE